MKFQYLILCSFISFGVFSQTVYKEDFGTGSDSIEVDWYTQGFQPLLTIYHCPPAYPKDGVFVVTANDTIGFEVASCTNRKPGDMFNPGWHQNLKDHTPDDEYGRFLLMNAVSTHNVLFQKTVTGLEPNTLYTFSMWLANIFDPNYKDRCYPDAAVRLMVTIVDGDGTQKDRPLTIFKYNTGNIPAQETLENIWQEYGGVFKSNSPTCTIIIRNQGRGGCGNDFAMDDLMIKKKG